MTDTVKKNVVNLGDYDQMRRGLGSGPGTQALRQVRDYACKRLDNYVERMMEQIDDALFARAEKAENNMAQTQYFDAMRELRIIRKDIETDFINGFCDQFNQGVPRSGGSDAALSLNFEDESSIGLVGKNDMEEDLAISNMITKTRGTCTQTLYSLDKRIGFLIRDPDLERWQNPLGPEAICAAFKHAVQRIETGLEIRLVIFKLFDQHVVCHMNELYKELNQQLVKLGVMPEIKATVRKSNHYAPRPPAPVGGGNVSEGYDAAPGGDALVGNYAPGGNYSSYGGYGQPAGAGTGGMPASLSALTFLQQGGEGGDSSGGGFSVDPAALASGNVNILHGIRQSPIIKELGKAGDTTIDIIAMMFDYILDDKSVPSAMRALIGRLQIPVLKVALMDKEFFSKKSHPARQLLNRLAATAMEWNEDQGDEDPLYQKISSVVQTILDKFEEDTSLFETVLEDFEDFLRHEEERAEVRAERSAKVMEGQEKLDVAKSTTLEEIEPRLNTGENSEFVREFVTNHWKNLLFITCARQGKDSEAWNQAVATMDDLIWSVKPKHTIADRKRLVAMQPVLLGNLRAGMERLAIPATERDDFIAKLVHAHGRTAVNKDTAASDDLSEIDATTDEAVTAVPENNTSIPETVADLPTGKTEVDNTASISTAKCGTDASCEAPAINDDVMSRVKRLATGTWMEFHGADGKPVRAKLSWISPITNTYLFTDRKGLKAGNYGIEELAELIRGARARVVDNNAPLMDRAVSSVLSEYNKH